MKRIQTHTHNKKEAETVRKLRLREPEQISKILESVMTESKTNASMGWGKKRSPNRDNILDDTQSFKTVNPNLKNRAYDTQQLNPVWMDS